ncbi:hypothetical protein NL358_27350, partial [Klebsiella pneumoniae]|nr:hypothetical protein [Klebsiella pneumoniae]
MPDELGHVNDTTQHITQPIQVLDDQRRLSRRMRPGYPIHEQLATHQRPLRQQHKVLRRSQMPNLEQTRRRPGRPRRRGA